MQLRASVVLLIFWMSTWIMFCLEKVPPMIREVGPTSTCISLLQLNKTLYAIPQVILSPTISFIWWQWKFVVGRLQTDDHGQFHIFQAEGALNESCWNR